MNFFYQRRSVETSIFIKPLDAFTLHDVLQFYDQVYVGKDVVASLEVKKLDRLTISVSPETRCVDDPLQHLDSLVCRAVVDNDMPIGLGIPSSYAKLFRCPHSALPSTQILSNTRCSIAIVQPVQLSQVFLFALTEASYDLARTNPSLLEDWFCTGEHILRQYATYTFSQNAAQTSTDPIQFRLLMAEPVLQGYASVGITKFFVSTYEDQNHSWIQPFHSSPASEFGTDSDKDCIEIDENFLAGSALHTISNHSRPASPLSFIREDATDLNAFPSLSDDSSPISATIELSFSCEAWHGPHLPHAEDHTVYIRTSDLGRTGLLNGDWAVICLAGSTRYRLVCVIAADNLVTKPGILMASPTLIFNIHGGTVPLDLTVCLRGSPFGSRRPTIPTARTITIARVASPLSTDRTYQPLFLHALKQYFDSENGTKRILKHGDMISTDIDPNDLRTLSGRPDGNDNSDVDLIPHRLPICMSHPSETIFFLVTNIEYDVVSNEDRRNPPDTYTGSTMGELGCWVDPLVTRIIQTGLEHSRVPDVASRTRTDARSSRAVFSSFAKQTYSHILSPESPYGTLHKVVSAALLKHAAEYRLHLSLLLKGPRGVGKTTIATWVSQSLGVHLLNLDCFDLIGDNDAQTEGTLRARFDKASLCSPCILLLRNIDALMQTTQSLEPGKEPHIINALRDCMDELQQPWKLTGYPVVIVGTTCDPGKCSPCLLACFKHEITFDTPDESARAEILEVLSQGWILGPDVSFSNLAMNTAALVAMDLFDLMNRAKSASIERTMKSAHYSPFDLISAGVSVTDADITVALENARASYSDSIGAPRIPNVTWDDVGGLASVKADILDTIQLPLERPELFADGLKKRSGILLYGPPGTGKTLLAKAVATSCSLNFLSVKGPEILNMYIGESEANIRRIFQRARNAKPCVIFFDELDSVAPKRGAHGDSGGVMDRIVSQLLAELDGMTSGASDVFVIGATNRPDLLDPALLRPGRFDRMLYLGVSDSHRAQLNIVEALTRKFRLHPDLDLASLVEKCPFHYTGADFYALCSDAMLKAMSRKAERIDAKLAILNQTAMETHPYPITSQYYLAEMATPADSEVLVSQEDFELALRELKPSVSETEMQHYARVQQQFSERIQ